MFMKSKEVDFISNGRTHDFIVNDGKSSIHK